MFSRVHNIFLEYHTVLYSTNKQSLGVAHDKNHLKKPVLISLHNEVTVLVG